MAMFALNEVKGMGLSMKKKRKLKRGIRKTFLVIIVLLIIGLVCRNKYYYYKFNHDDEMPGSLIEIENINSNVDGVSYLESVADKDYRIKIIIENKDNYPKILLEMLSRNLDMTDYVFHYLDLRGQVFSNNIGEVTKNKYPLLLQYDTRWGYGMYGDDVMAINGCGPTSLAMIIAGLTGRNDITPYDIATYSYQNGYYEGGTSWLLFTKGVKHYGIDGTEIPLSKSKMIAELDQGHPIICSMGKGDFTTTGHIITIIGIKDGKFIINDPNSKKRSEMLWDYERIEKQIKNLWSFKIS